MGIKVKDALKIGGLKEARVLSGHGGLNNKIEHVDVIEMPDIDGDMMTAVIEEAEDGFFRGGRK